MSKTLDTFQRVLLYALLVPVAIVIVDTLLQAFNAQEDNPIVSTIDGWADSFTLEVFETMFAEQSYVQTALVTLIVYGVVALLVVALFKGLRSLLGSPGPSGS